MTLSVGEASGVGTPGPGVTRLRTARADEDDEEPYALDSDDDALLLRLY